MKTPTKFLALAISISAIGAQEDARFVVPFKTLDSAQASNGLLSMTVAPIESPLTKRELLAGRASPRPWEGRLEITVTNVSRGTVRIDEGGPVSQFSVAVTDTAGKTVPMTKMGLGIAASHSDPTGIVISSGFTRHLLPSQSFTYMLNAALIYQLRSGYGYTVKIERSSGLPTIDEAGRPLPKDRCKLAVIVQIPGKMAEE